MEALGPQVTQLPKVDAGPCLSFPNLTGLPLPGQEVKWPGWYMPRWNLPLTPDLSPQISCDHRTQCQSLVITKGTERDGVGGLVHSPARGTHGNYLL